MRRSRDTLLLTALFLAAATPANSQSTDPAPEDPCRIWMKSIEAYSREADEATRIDDVSDLYSALREASLAHESGDATALRETILPSLRRHLVEIGTDRWRDGRRDD